MPIILRRLLFFGEEEQMKKKVKYAVVGPDGRIFFECDRKACENCHPECRYTSKREHAADIEVEFPEGALDVPGAGGPAS